MYYIWKLTGGRPMILIERLFWDKIGRQQVNLYRDRLGRHWTATSKWARFRCRSLREMM